MCLYIPIRTNSYFGINFEIFYAASRSFSLFFYSSIHQNISYHLIYVLNPHAVGGATNLLFAPPLDLLPLLLSSAKSNATSKVGYHSAYQAYKGLNWPIVYKFEVPSSFPSGFYIVKGKTLDTHKAIAEHYFIVRPSHISSNKNSNSKKDRILLILSTNTWNCYNQFGGASAYESKEVSEISKSWIGDPNGGLDIPFHELFRGTPMLSWKRPIIPGII